MWSIFPLQILADREGVIMEFPDKMVCKELLLDLVCYEIYCKRLSPEMEHLFERHLEECPSCRRRILGFRRILQENQETDIVRNFG
jgi:hypothetical protein